MASPRTQFGFIIICAVGCLAAHILVVVCFVNSHNSLLLKILSIINCLCGYSLYYSITILETFSIPSIKCRKKSLKFVQYYQKLNRIIFCKERQIRKHQKYFQNTLKILQFLLQTVYCNHQAGR